MTDNLTNQDQVAINPDEIFSELNVSRILIAAIESAKQIEIPASVLLQAKSGERDLQVDYDSDNQIFIFKIREKDEQGNNNN